MASLTAAQQRIAELEAQLRIAELESQLRNVQLKKEVIPPRVVPRPNQGRGTYVQHEFLIPQLTVMVPTVMPINAVIAILSHNVAHEMVFKVTTLKEFSFSKILMVSLNLKMDYARGTPQGDFVRGVMDAPEDRPYELHFVDKKGYQRYFKVKVFKKHPRTVEPVKEPAEEPVKEPTEEPTEESEDESEEESEGWTIGQTPGRKDWDASDDEEE